MRRPVFHAALLALCLALSITPAPAEQPDAVDCMTEWEPGRIGGYRVMTIPFRRERPDGVAELAALRDGRYARIRWGTGKGLLLALDVAPGHERLFIDLDRDGDLADETSTTWWGPGRSGVRTESVPVSYDEDVETVPVRFQRVANDAVDQVRIVPWVHRRGRVALGGRLRLVALAESFRSWKRASDSGPPASIAAA